MGHLPSRDGTRIYERIWNEVEQPKGTLVLLHGYGEHIARYDASARELNRAGWIVRGIDYRGHGDADGIRGHVRFFSEYLDDLDTALVAARAGSPAPIFLVSHSHGGLISLRYLIEYPKAPIKGLVALSPFLHLALKPPAWKTGLGRLMSAVMPSLGIPAGLHGVDVSRDPEIQRSYDSDPRNNKLARARWFTEMSHAQQEVFARAAEISVPSLFLIAGGDKIADPDFSKQVFDRLGSADKDCEIYPGYFHELLNEPALDRAKVVSRLTAWLDAHT